MSATEYYNHTTFPSPNAPGSSAQLRAELEKIETGFGKLPDLSGNGGKLVRVNAGGTALEATTAVTNPTVTGGTINNAIIGGSTPAAGTFTTLAATSATVGGAAVISAASTNTLTNKTISGADNTLSNIANASLTNSSVTIGSTSVALGATVTSFSGLTAVNATTFTGALVGNASTVTNGVYTSGSYSNPSWITSLDGSKITANLATSALTGTVAVTNGGTGASTASGGRLALLPTVAANGGKVLAVNAGATDVEWKTVAGTGTVTSVDFSGGTTGLSASGGPITAAGTLTLSGTLALGNGGTGQTTAQGAMNALAAATTSGQYLRGNGSNVVMSAIQAADVPTLNQNTSGTAANVTGTVAIANGGTGQTTQQAALNALAGAVTSGKVLRGNGTNVVLASLQAGDIPALPYVAATDAVNIGTTSVTLNRASAAQSLTGITSIDGSAAKWTTARNLAGNSVDGSANVAFANKFIAGGTSDSGLSGAQFLGALGTGLVMNTTTSGTLSIADPAVDYQSCITTVGLLKGSGSGSVGAATAGSDYQAAITATGLLKGAGGGSVGAASAGTDYAAPGATTTYTVAQNFAASGITLKGSSTGKTTFASANSSGTDYTITFPAATGTVLTSAGAGTDYVTLAGAESLTNKTVTAVAQRETKVALGAGTSIDLATGNVFTKTISGTTSLSVTNVPSTGTSVAFVLDLTNGGSATVNLWSGVKWPSGAAPTLTSSGRDMLGFVTHDGGTVWNAFLLGKAMA